LSLLFSTLPLFHPGRPALCLARPACRTLESGHPGNPPAGLTAGPGTEAWNRLWTI